MPAKQKTDATDNKGKGETEAKPEPAYSISDVMVTVGDTSLPRGMPATVGVLKAMHLTLTQQGLKSPEALEACLGALINDPQMAKDKLASIDAGAAGLLLSVKVKAINNGLASYNAKNAEACAQIDTIYAQIDSLTEQVKGKIDSLKDGAIDSLGETWDKVFDISYAPGTGLIADSTKKTKPGGSRAHHKYNYLAKPEYTWLNTGFGTGKGSDLKYTAVLSHNDGATASGGGTEGAWTCKITVTAGAKSKIDSTYTAHADSANKAVKGAVIMMREANKGAVKPVKVISLSVPDHFDIPVIEPEPEPEPESESESES